MIIQIVLSAMLAGIALLVANQESVSRLLRLTVLAVVALGAWFVWVPEITDRIAGFFGVGRGADLVLYIWVVITLALIVFLYLKLAHVSRKLTQLTRAVALVRPLHPEPGADPRDDSAP